MMFYVPTDGVESWRRRLAHPELHWERGRSARTLATCWEQSEGFPGEVTRAVESYARWQEQGLEPLVGFPEHKTPLPGGERPSQSDIPIVARSGSGLVVMTVEGKVDEGFDRPLHEWLGSSPSAGKRQRLAYLWDQLGFDTEMVQGIPYQLLHRAVSAVVEADRFTAEPAMLVHSWGSLDGFDNYASFLSPLGADAISDGFVAGRLSSGVIHLGWVQGDPTWLAK